MEMIQAWCKYSNNDGLKMSMWFQSLKASLGSFSEAKVRFGTGRWGVQPEGPSGFEPPPSFKPPALPEVADLKQTCAEFDFLKTMKITRAPLLTPR